MNNSVLAHVCACLRAARLRTSALLTASLALASVAFATLPALAAAHSRRPADAGRSARRHAVRRSLVRPRTRTLIVTSDRERGLAVGRHGHAARRLRIRRRCVDSRERIGRATRLETERATACLLNRQRIRRGLPPLRLNDRLDRSAQSWTNTMVRDHSFSHGSDFASRISAVGFDWSQIGENIADGYGTPAGAVRAWMASTGHCENILNPDFREVGAGFDIGSAVGGYQHGTWTTDFALRMGQHAASAQWAPAEGCPY